MASTAVGQSNTQLVVEITRENGLVNEVSSSSVITNNEIPSFAGGDGISYPTGQASIKNGDIEDPSWY